MATIDLSPLRKQFPALNIEKNGKKRIYLDGAGGTQLPQSVIDAMVHYMINDNGNYGGYFDTSITTDKMLIDVRKSLADFFNAPSYKEVILGPNMTTLTFSLVWSISKVIKPGDEIVISRMGHGGNIDAWNYLSEQGAKVRFLELNEEDCTLDYKMAEEIINPKTKIVALGLASNATGTINDVKRIAKLAHEVGAMVFVDAVHFAPHLPMDVIELDADFLACSAYKFFGPHVGFIWGKSEHLERIDPHRPWPEFSDIPGKYNLGTPNMEGLAGTIAAIDYIASIGKEYGNKFEDKYKEKGFTGKRLELKKAMSAIGEYELILGKNLNKGLKEVEDLKVYGITDEEHFDKRCPTFSFTLKDYNSADICKKMNSEGIFVWNGEEGFGALELVKYFNLVKRGGLLRVSIEHYNTEYEIERFLEVLNTL
ncbi:cysteine desulfurase-like protein [Actinomycetota bacterium]